MSDDAANATETDESGPKALREKLARVESELEGSRKQLNRQRMQLLEGAFDSIGLDPTKGLGKAIAEKFDGDPTADAVREFAVSEYSWEPPAEAQEVPLAADIASAQQRVSQAQATSVSTPTLEIDYRIAEAEEKGDFAATMQLKLDRFRQQQGI